MLLLSQIASSSKERDNALAVSPLKSKKNSVVILSLIENVNDGRGWEFLLNQKIETKQKYAASKGLSESNVAHIFSFEEIWVNSVK